MVRWIVIVVVVIVIGAAGYAWTTSGTTVETAIARRGDISEYIAERGKTRLPRTYRITMPIDGRIRPIELTEGDLVRADEVIARIEIDDLDTAVAMAEARVRRLQASIIENNDTRIEDSTIVELDSVLESVARSVEASKTQTEASLAREQYHITDLARKTEAFEHNAATRQELDEAQLDDIESRIDYRTDVLGLRALEAIEQAVRIWPLQVRQMIEKKGLKEAVLEHELAEARAAFEQAARDRDRAEIRSPVDGVVLERRVSNKLVLPAGAVLVEIGRLADLEVEVEVLSQEAIDIEVGDRVDITVPTGAPPPLVGTVSRIDPRGFTKVSSLGVEQQRVLAIVSFDPESLAAFRDAGYSLGVGYRLRVRIYTDSRANAVVIPRSALFRSVGGDWQVFAVRGGRARLETVRVGLLNDREAQIESGLEAGDEVILAPETGLEDGARVAPR